MKDISGHTIQTMMSMIENARHISIVTHMKPDGDAMGSSLGLYRFLLRNVKARIKIVLPSECPRNLAFMVQEGENSDILVHSSNDGPAFVALMESDLIFCLDFNSFHRTVGLQQALQESQAAKILIDHHLNPDRSMFDLVFSETEISSTSELLYYILVRTPYIDGEASRLGLACASAIYTGMTTDTNNFNNSTYPSTLAMASELIACGVDRDVIIEKVMHSYRENRMRLLGTLLKDNMVVIPEGGACIVLDKKTIQEYDIVEGDTEGFVNIPLDIANVRMSIFVKEEDGKARVSIRSKKGTSANRCATTYFHGGGHENASGGKIIFPDDITDISMAKDYILGIMESFLNE